MIIEIFRKSRPANRVYTLRVNRYISEQRIYSDLQHLRGAHGWGSARYDAEIDQDRERLSAEFSRIQKGVKIGPFLFDWSVFIYALLIGALLTIHGVCLSLLF